MQQSQTNVLIVDDEPDMVRIYADVLRHAGHNVMTACDGTTALALADDYSPDVVLLDVKLPGESGLALLPQFKTRDPEVQVIMLTVLDEAEPAAQAIHNGAFAYLVKPASIHEVRATVAQAQATRQAQTCLCFGNLSLDLCARQAHLDGHPLKLTDTEWRLLVCLARHQEGATYANLWQAAWSHSPPPIKP